jgi:putative hydrolase of the HAD superfamily
VSRYGAIIFDLFGTVVHFRGRPDPTVGWLRGALAETCPGLDFAAFRGALGAVSGEILAARGDECVEVPSRERFRRALARAGGEEAMAEALSLAHMAYLADQTLLPDEHSAVLAALGARHRLGVVSNFDHGPTARAVLERHGVGRHFAVTLISADFGRRKPHPAIFAAALAQLECAPSQALYVGDTHAEDVVGALAAGMDVAWLTPPDAPARDPRPTYRIATLAEVARVAALA